MLKHFYVKFGDTSCIGFWDIVWYNRETTHRQTEVKTLPPRLLSACVLTNAQPHSDTWY